MTTRPRVFFVHVMKTGGKSVGKLLGSRFDASAVYPDTTRGEGPDAKVFVEGLLALSDERRAAIECYSVHMPAWIAEHVAPDFTTLTVLREPVARTISHLRHIARIEYAPDDIEEIYDDPGWHGRLTNYQTRLFALSKQDYDDDRERAQRFGEEADEDNRRQLLLDLQQVWTTGITSPGALDDTHLSRAITRLDGFDEVATTENIQALVDRLGPRLGCTLPPIPHVNAAADPQPAPAALTARIRRDNELDIAFYEHTLELIADRT